MKAKKAIEKMYLKELPNHILMVIILNINAIVDSIFAGMFLNQDALSAIAYYAPISNIAYLSSIFVLGSNLICCREIGCGNKKKAVSVVSTGFFAVFLYCFALAALLIFAGPVLCNILGTPGNINLILYMKSMAINLIASTAFSFCMNYLPMNDKGRIGKIALTLLIILNCLANYVFIVHFNMGIFGLGMASSVSSMFAAGLALSGFFSKNKEKLAVYISVKEINPVLLRDIIISGVQEFTFNMSLAIRGLALNYVVTFVAGTSGMAALIVFNIYVCFTGAISHGTGGAIACLGSICYGEDSLGEFIDMIKFALKNALLMAAVCVLGTFLISKNLSMAFFDYGSQTYEITVSMFRICCWTLIFEQFTKSILSAYMCQNEIMLSNSLTLFPNIVTAILFFPLSLIWGINGVWMSFLAASFLTLMLIFVIVLIRNKRIPECIHDIIITDTEFGAGGAHTFSMSVNKLEDVSHCSISLDKFLQDYSINSRRRYFMSLSVEELLRNILEHGHKHENGHLIDCIAVVKNGKIQIHIKDNLKEFDPCAYLEQFASDDPTQNIGLKLVGKIVDEMSYKRVHGFNIISFASMQ